MKFAHSYALKDIASLIDCDYVGDPLFEVLGMNEIHVVSAGDIVFVDHPKYYEKALNSKATVILINKTVPCPKGKALIPTIPLEILIRLPLILNLFTLQVKLYLTLQQLEIKQSYSQIVLLVTMFKLVRIV